MNFLLNHLLLHLIFILLIRQVISSRISLWVLTFILISASANAVWARSCHFSIGTCTLCGLQGPGPDARIVYIDGAFDLFHAGHVEVYCMNKLFASFFKKKILNGSPWRWCQLGPRIRFCLWLIKTLCIFFILALSIKLLCAYYSITEIFVICGWTLV